MTSTETVQEPPPMIEPPVSIIPASPTSSVPPPESWRLPPQSFVVVKGVATTRPDGKASVKATCEKDCEGLGLLIVNVRVEVPLGAIEFGLKALLIEGGRRQAPNRIETVFEPWLAAAKS